MKTTRKTIFLSIVVVSLLAVSSSAAFANVSGSEDGGDAPIAPKSADTIPDFADEDSIVDPRGQSVKESADLDLSREMTVDVVNPIDWELEVDGFEVIDAEIPMNLDLNLGMGFPLKAETSYDPYDVHKGESFTYVVDVDNEDCTPYADLGVDFSMDFADLNFQLFESSNLLEFSTDWGSIDYSESVTIPFYGTTTEFGDWINYDIVDEYYSIDDILSLAGANVKLSDYGLKGGVGVNVNYRLHSWVTADMSVMNQTGDVVQSETLNWQDIGAKEVSVSIDSDAIHGEYYSIDVGDWVYHVAHDVTFTVWADVGLDVFGIGLIDETFDYSYTLGLGELTFPEKEDYTFQSKPQVLSGKSTHNVPANWDLVELTLDTQGGSGFQLLDYQWDIPQNPTIQEWFDDVNVDAGISAEIDATMPFNMLSYYNSRKVVPDNTFDYNVLVDSVGSDNPSINYGVDAYIDLSNVDLLGFQLDRYDINFEGDIYEFSDITTPFGSQTHEIDITSLVQLDKASDMLNDYLSKQLYGVNPDIQFQAWLTFEMDGYMTGTATTSAGSISEATEFMWDEQFDTQTSRIDLSEAGLNSGDDFTVSYSDLTYNVDITPGIKVGVSMLGGIIGFELPISLPLEFSLNDKFNAPDFTETITVEDSSVEASNLQVDLGDDPVSTDDFTVEGSFDVKNTGTTLGNYDFRLIANDLPAGTTATFSPSSITDVAVDDTRSIDYTVTLGPDAHTWDYKKDKLEFIAYSTDVASVSDNIGTELTLSPAAGFEPNLAIQMEDSIEVYPGVGVSVPVKVTNEALIADNDISVSLSGDTNYASLSSTATFDLAAGESKSLNILLDVPGVSTSTPGTYSVSFEANSKTATLNYEILSFTDVRVNLADANDVESSEVVSLGDDSNYQLTIENKGNSQATATMYIESDTISSFNVNGNPGATSIELNAGSEKAINLELILSGVAPGVNNFTLKVNESGETLFSQSFDINVEQVQVESIYADDYEYDTTDGTVTYTINVRNVGDTADSFDIGILGLDESAYNLKTATGDDPDNVFIPSGASVNLELAIAPTDIRKVLAGVNGFQVSAKSEAYGTEYTEKASAVKMPAVYGFYIPLSEKKVSNGEDTYSMTFLIENTGNVDDTFTISVDGIGNQYYEIVSTNSSVHGTAQVIGDNGVFVPRGKKVLVTVNILKTEKGDFKPQVSIVNSEDTVLQTFQGNFSTAKSSNALLIVLAIVGALGSVAIGFRVYDKRNQRKLGEAFGAVDENEPSKLSKLKKKFSTKLGKKRELSMLEELKAEEDKEALEEEDIVSDRFEKIEEPLEVKEIEDDVGDSSVDKVKSGLVTVKDKFKTGLSRVKGKIDSIREERRDLKALADDESFWDDSEDSEVKSKKNDFIDEDDFDIDDDDW